jgi:hypothetical protein
MTCGFGSRLDCDGFFVRRFWSWVWFERPPALMTPHHVVAVISVRLYSDGKGRYGNAIVWPFKACHSITSAMCFELNPPRLNSYKTHPLGRTSSKGVSKDSRSTDGDSGRLFVDTPWNFKKNSKSLCRIRLR